MLKSIVQLAKCRLLLKSNAILQIGAGRSLCVPVKSFGESVGSEEKAGAVGVSVDTKKKQFNPFAGTAHVDSTVEPTAAESEIDRDKRLKVLQLEADIAHQEGRRVPALDFIQEHHWNYVLTLPTRSARLKYYGYLWQIEMKKESDKRKKAQRAEEAERRVAEIRKEREENPHIIYGLGHTSMFLRIYDSTIDRFQNNRLIQAMQFGSKVVLDCSYDAYMNNREAMQAAKQLMLCFAENRSNDEPFDLHYCNVNLDSLCIQALKRFIPPMTNTDFPMNVHSQCFTELFPKKDLVYLTPHCREDLKAYNPDDIYIVGAMVDTVNNEPLSLAKAKRLGLRMARLPLDHYLQWGAGSGKSLTLNQMISIMLDLKKTADWEVALKHVPRRKIIDIEREHWQTQERKANPFRLNKVNVRIDQLLNNDIGPRKLRSHKEGLEFEINNWAMGNKKRKQNS